MAEFIGSALNGELCGRLDADDVAEIAAHADEREDRDGGGFVLWLRSSDPRHLRYAPITIEPLDDQAAA